MPRKKLQKYEEIKSSPYVFQHSDLLDKDMAVFWKNYFGNNSPIILELGCGYGEYTTGLAEYFYDCNVIGVDIKGDRIWQGAKIAEEKNLKNVAFINARIEQIALFFSYQSVSTIWITFPDPQPKQPKHRLTHPRFIEQYKQILKENGNVYLKTDNTELFKFTYQMLQTCGMQNQVTDDLYSSSLAFKAYGITTHYEKIWQEKGEKIKLIEFKLA